MARVEIIGHNYMNVSKFKNALLQIIEENFNKYNRHPEDYKNEWQAIINAYPYSYTGSHVITGPERQAQKLIKNFTEGPQKIGSVNQVKKIANDVVDTWWSSQSINHSNADGKETTTPKKVDHKITVKSILGGLAGAYLGYRMSKGKKDSDRMKYVVAGTLIGGLAVFAIAKYVSPMFEPKPEEKK